MSREYPKIIIKDGWLLRGNASQYLHKQWAKKDEKLADDKDMEKIVAAYNNAWDYVEKHGYKEINNSIKNIYTRIKNEYIDK